MFFFVTFLFIKYFVERYDWNNINGHQMKRKVHWEQFRLFLVFLTFYRVLHYRFGLDVLKRVRYGFLTFIFRFISFFLLRDKTGILFMVAT